MAFTTNISGVGQVDDSIKLAFDQAFLLETAQANVMDQLVNYRVNIGAKSIQFPKYSQLSLATTPLTEGNDVVSEALSDSAILLTPAEYGQVVTTTSLASLQTGGTVDLAAVAAVGQNLSRTKNRLAALALDASTNVLVAGGKTESTLAGTDVLTASVLNAAYNKLARKSVGRLNGEYVLVAHDDVIADLRDATGAGSWVDVTKYATPGATLNNEVGMFKGFRVIRNNDVTYGDQSGAGTVDVYNSYVIGLNGLGLAESFTPEMRATGPFDKLGRLVNLGWYGVFAYGIVDTDAVWKIQTASSVGANS